MKFLRYLPLHRVGILGSLIGVKSNFFHQCFADDRNEPGSSRPLPQFMKCPYYEAIAKAETDIHGQLVTQQASGALLTIYVDGECVYNSAYGMSDDENKIPCHVDNKMRIGNMTMIFTSAQVLNFCQRTSQDLNKVLNFGDWNVSGNNNRFTIKNLLNHCAGFFPSPPEEPGHTRTPLTDSFSLGREFVNRASMDPGPFMFASNGYNLVGAYLQSQCYYSNLREMPYPQLFQAMISDMDLRNTLMEEPNKVVTFLTKHYSDSDTEVAFSDASMRYPSSGLVSNSRDLAKFGEEILYHEQHNPYHDKRIPFLRNLAKVWAPEKCLRHDSNASHDFGNQEKWSSDGCEDTPQTCMGYSYGWNVELVPTIAGSMNRFTVQASSEGIGDSFTGALVVRYGVNSNPFIFCAESEHLENSHHNHTSPANVERKKHSTKGIVVALLFNGADVDAGPIAKKLAKNIETFRHVPLRA